MLSRTSASLRTASAVLPPSFAADLYSEADVMDALADESQVDPARAAKASSYDATTKSRFRGRQTRGGRLVLRCADGSTEAVLEEWEVQRLWRGLPDELARLLRPSRTVRSEASAQAFADVLDVQHPAHTFFSAAAARGGFSVERA